MSRDKFEYYVSFFHFS